MSINNIGTNYNDYYQNVYQSNTPNLDEMKAKIIAFHPNFATILEHFSEDKIERIYNKLIELYVPLDKMKTDLEAIGLDTTYLSEEDVKLWYFEKFIKDRIVEGS